jgi:tetratricopeptide (TPR) repeat protein
MSHAHQNAPRKPARGSPAQRKTARPLTPTKLASGEAHTHELSRRWWAALGAIIFWGLFSQILVLAEAWAKNPFARVPTADADVYWRWAGEIAVGRLLANTPFMSAPLYPYAVGGLRALGGGLLSLYCLQAAVHLTTLGLLAYGAARRFGPIVGLVAGALYVLLLEPAYFTGRVLNCNCQLLSVALLWLALLRVERRPSLVGWILAGALTGLNCLLNPTMLLGVPALTLWAWCQGAWNRRGLAHAAVFAAAALVVISPATLHNYLVCHEFIPISGQAGITFAQGNAPGADGTLTQIPGITGDRQAQNLEVLRIYRNATRESGGWNAASSFFFHKGLDYWRANPGEATGLFLRKLWWFLTGRNFGDIYMPALELEAGLANWLWTAPLPLAWLTLPALIGIIVMARWPRRHGPELILFGVPLLTVLIFWYSPRYRLPALPMIVVASAWAIVQAAKYRTSWKWTLAAGPAAVVGLTLGLVNYACDVDRADSYRPHFCYALGTALRNTGHAEQAAAQYRRTLELKPDFGKAACTLGMVLLESGKIEDGLASLRRAIEIDPTSAFFHCQLGRALINQGQTKEGVQHLETAVQLAPNEAPYYAHLASGLVQIEDYDRARRHLLTALDLDPAFAQAHLDLAGILQHGGDSEGAVRHMRAALRSNPALTDGRGQLVQTLLGQLLWDRGDAPGAIEALRRAHQLAPASVDILNNLAWYLAVTPGLPPADRAEALRLARELTGPPDRRTPGNLDTLATALAASGGFHEAVSTMEQALTQANKLGQTALAEELGSRLKLYRAGKPYVAPAPSTRP